MMKINMISKEIVFRVRNHGDIKIFILKNLEMREVTYAGAQSGQLLV